MRKGDIYASGGESRRRAGITRTLYPASREIHSRHKQIRSRGLDFGSTPKTDRRFQNPEDVAFLNRKTLA